MAKLPPRTEKSGTRVTKNYIRERIAAPASFKKGSFRTIDVGKGKKVILGKKRGSQKLTVQAVLKPRKKRVA